MSAEKRRRREIPEPDIYRIETRLGAALHQIPPRPAFVSDLRSRLQQEPPGPHYDPHAFQALFVSLVSVIGALLLIAAGARAILALRNLSRVMLAVNRNL